MDNNLKKILSITTIHKNLMDNYLKKILSITTFFNKNCIDNNLFKKKKQIDNKFTYQKFNR